MKSHWHYQKYSVEPETEVSEWRCLPVTVKVKGKTFPKEGVQPDISFPLLFLSDRRDFQSRKPCLRFPPGFFWWSWDRNQHNQHMYIYVNKMIIGYHSDLAWEKLNVSQTPVSLIYGPCGGLPTWFADWKEVAWAMRGKCVTSAMLIRHFMKFEPQWNAKLLNHHHGTPSNLEIKHKKLNVSGGNPSKPSDSCCFSKSNGFNPWFTTFPQGLGWQDNFTALITNNRPGAKIWHTRRVYII